MIEAARTSNPYDPVDERKEWLRWQVSDELAASIAPGLRDGSPDARRVLVAWLTHDRERLVSHCLGAVGSSAFYFGIKAVTRGEIEHEIDLVAFNLKVD